MGKKKKQKPNLRLVKNDPTDITMDDINNAVDKIIIENDHISEADLANVFTKGWIAESLVKQPEKTDEFGIIVNKNSEELLFDAVPLEKLLVKNKKNDGGNVWIVSIQSMSEEHNHPYGIRGVTDEQAIALKVLQNEIAELYITYPNIPEELKINVKKQHSELIGNEAKNLIYNRRIEFHIEQFELIYRISEEPNWYLPCSSD